MRVWYLHKWREPSRPQTTELGSIYEDKQRSFNPRENRDRVLDSEAKADKMDSIRLRSLTSANEF